MPRQERHIQNSLSFTVSHPVHRHVAGPGALVLPRPAVAAVAVVVVVVGVVEWAIARRS